MLGSIFMVAFSVAMFVLYVWSIIWAYGDAEARGKPGCLVALLVMLLSWPIGLILWIVFRPDNGRRRY
jgi:hypothetical protein